MAKKKSGEQSETMFQFTNFANKNEHNFESIIPDECVITKVYETFTANYRTNKEAEKRGVSIQLVRRLLHASNNKSSGILKENWAQRNEKNRSRRKVIYQHLVDIL